MPDDTKNAPARNLRNSDRVYYIRWDADTQRGVLWVILWMAVTAIRNLYARFGSEWEAPCPCLGSDITLRWAMPEMEFPALSRGFLILTFTVLTVTTSRCMNFNFVRWSVLI